MTESYWTKFTNQRIGRRRALALTGGAAMGAALLAACGGGDGGPAGPVDKSGLVTKPADTFSQAKRGGVLKHHMPSEPRNLDVTNPQADLNGVAPEIYSTLFVETPGKLKSSAYVLQGDLAQSFELSGDGLQITAKLRPGVKFHNRPPVNGRALDADDVLASWDFYAKQAPLRTLLANSVAPDAPVLGFSAPDSRTIVIKLKEPVSYILNSFASFGSFTGQVLIFPKEVGSTFDIRRDMVGTGPFFLKEHVPSVSFEMARNPDYWDKDFALVDSVSAPIVSEYAARRAQFKAGNIHFLTTLRQEDIVPLQKEEPRLRMYEADLVTDSSVFTFGHLPVGKNKLQDERVRQAISMSLDRNLYIDAQYNADKFKTEGLPVRTVWNSHLPALDPWVEGGWFLDPQGSEFGPNAKYFQHNVPEAKKLLAAAGFPNGFEIKVQYPAAAQFNRATVVEPYIFFLQEIGLKVIQNAEQDYTQGYIPNIRDAEGALEGMGYHSVTGGIPATNSPESNLISQHWPPSGVTFHGYDVNGKGDKSGDPALTAILAKARVERDVEARKKLIKDAQRHLGKAMHSLVGIGGATGFVQAWPAVANYRVWRSVSPWRYFQIWLDTTKAPFV